MRSNVASFTVVCVLVASVSRVVAQTPDLTTLSLEELLNVEITSVSRKEETLLRTAAAVYVITEDDIRRSGATTLPDLFRMVPGLSVAQLNANTWSVTARGFGGTHANKLLVLIDGRSTYAPLNGGVNWEMQLLPLDAVAQVEVIRGPGGSLWGTNAINGVINIITKTAHQSPGARVATHASRYEPGTVDFSYGGRFGTSGAHVTQGRYFQRQSSGLTSGRANGDDLDAAYARTRLDWGAQADTFSFQADLLRSTGSRVHSEARLSPPYRTVEETGVESTAGNALFAWKRSARGRTESSVQLFYSGLARAELAERAHTADLDVRQRRRLGARHDLVAGVGYRSILGTVSPGPSLVIRPGRVHEHLMTAFLQDEVAIADALRVSAGGRVERSSETGIAVQPTVRGLWAVSPRQSVWGAVSRAVRVPNRFERGMFILLSAGAGPAGLPLAVTLEGSRDTKPEILTEYEAGYRVLWRTVSIDLAAFIGAYDDLASHTPAAPGIGEVFGARAFRVPLVAANEAFGTSRGVEVAGAWKPMPWWQVAGSYSTYDVDFGSRTGSAAESVPINGPVPGHLLHLRGSIDLTGGFGAGALFYRASTIEELQIPVVNRLDLRLTWTRGSVVLGAGAQNLLHAESVEYADRTARVLPSPVRVNPYVDVSWRF
ncbi:MAG: hypothetical protein A3I61_00020 [Acidobacteria bacterium RIFCSPLOWO2_02_FULL_68_18]|nr:MAG: hypothetical protein A3I61_00020 [Acidobacteria bacterium RIFCSPLOWO2_02_FULL_68_18]OFW48761.1 MAG: hypothetical protein A3G77_14780 [Acidobacteria bacterium RIFCSPLOWO2_12_FULL_68_19]